MRIWKSNMTQDDWDNYESIYSIPAQTLYQNATKSHMPNPRHWLGFDYTYTFQGKSGVSKVYVPNTPHAAAAFERLLATWNTNQIGWTYGRR